MSASIWSASSMDSKRYKTWSSSATPSMNLGLSTSMLFNSLMTKERLPWRLMKARIFLTVFSSISNSSRLTLVCSGVTFSAWSMIPMISEVLSWRFKCSRRPEMILRLLMRAKTGVSRLKLANVARRADITSAS